MKRLALVLSALLLHVLPAAASDEIQVYNGEIARPGEWSLLQHLNYGLRARREPAFPGGLPAHHTLNGTPELAYGVTDWYEIGLYAPFAARDDRFYPGGFKLRNLFVVPNAANQDVFYGLNTEISWAPERFSQSRWNLEFRPILGFRSGNWEFVTNPIVGMGLGGHQPSAFLPANRIAYAVQEGLGFGIETYSDLGPFGSFATLRNQAHQLFLVTDVTIAGIDVNFGIGRGLTSASDQWTVKTIFGFSF